MRRTAYKPHKYRSLVSSGTVRRKKRFRGVIITRSALVTAVCVISAAIFIFTAWMVIKNSGIGGRKAEIMKAGIADAMPFLSVKEDKAPGAAEICAKAIRLFTGADIKNPCSLAAAASPIFSAASPGNPDEDKSEKTIPLLVNENISDKNAASENLQIKNESKYQINPNELVNEELKFSISPEEPSVLIVHTHASESYTPSEAYNYVQTGNYRTQDEKYNMLRVGSEIEQHLKKSGINVIHDKTINDYPSYNDSYNKTEKVIRENLKKYPSICIVLDIHRDAVGDEQNGVKFTSTVNGEKAAQIMTVCGTDQNLENPEWRKNLIFALKIQKYFEEKYPSLLRPINLRKERFNMHLTTGSLLFEVGTNYNTLDEALSAARCLGDGLGEVINQLSQP